MVGRNDLMCDIDQKWNGPPPRCEPLICPDPPKLPHGKYKISRAKDASLIVTYECYDGHTLEGPTEIVCKDGSYDQPPPHCIPFPLRVPPVTVITSTSRSVSISSKEVSASTHPEPPKGNRIDANPEDNKGPIKEDSFENIGYDEDNFRDSEETGNSEHGVGHVTISDDKDHHHQYDDEDHYHNEEENKQGISKDVPLGGNSDSPVPPVDNDVSASASDSHIVRGKTPNVDAPRSSINSQSERKESPMARLNLGMMM